MKRDWLCILIYALLALVVFWLLVGALIVTACYFGDAAC